MSGEQGDARQPLCQGLLDLLEAAEADERVNAVGGGAAAGGAVSRATLMSVSGLQLLAASVRKRLMSVQELNDMVDSDGGGAVGGGGAGGAVGGGAAKAAASNDAGSGSQRRVKLKPNRLPMQKPMQNAFFIQPKK